MSRELILVSRPHCTVKCDPTLDMIAAAAPSWVRCMSSVTPSALPRAYKDGIFTVYVFEPEDPKGLIEAAREMGAEVTILEFRLPQSQRW